MKNTVLGGVMREQDQSLQDIFLTPSQIFIMHAQQILIIPMKL